MCLRRYTTFWDRVFGTYREPTQKTHPDEILTAALENAKNGGALDVEFDPNTDVECDYNTDGGKKCK